MNWDADLFPDILQSMEIKIANIDDSAKILALQKLAYCSEAALYGDFNIPPLIQTQDEIEADFKAHVYLKAVLEGTIPGEGIILEEGIIPENDIILGSVRGHLKDGTCHIGRLIVHPDHQNQGIGSQLLHAIESHFNQAQRFELFTGEKSERNLYLYRKLGYRVFITSQLTDRVKLLFLEKLKNEEAISRLKNQKTRLS
jgi:ribosomal protein S18 acetylase RimI-like enzyme